MIPVWLICPFLFPSLTTIHFWILHSSPHTPHKLKNSILKSLLKINLNLCSHTQNSLWYAYTHPHEDDYDFFADDLGEKYTIKPNFYYYDVDCFRNRKSLWNKQKTIGIFHTNICSLQANIEQVEDLLHDMDYTFDIIALTETWNPSKSKEKFSPKRIEGYLEYHGVEGSSLKGGCGFYIKDTYTPIPRKDLEIKITERDCETENCWIELVNEAGPNVLVGVFYRHPSRKNEIFLEKLKPILKKVNREKKKTIICGDFNLNLLNYEHDKNISSFLSTMFQYDFQPCITEPTRITNTNKPSLVDNIFINSFDDPVCGNILEHISYDHLPNFIILNHEHKNKKQSIKKRDKKNFDADKFQAELLDNGKLLLDLINEKTSDSACDLYLLKFTSKLDKEYPFRELSKKEKRILQNPWITPGILKSISTKRTLFRKFKSDKFKDKESTIFKQYKTHNDCINKLKRICKKDHFQKYFLDNFKNSKNKWLGIQNILRTKALYLMHTKLLTNSMTFSSMLLVNLVTKL